jgi:homoaconitate hydratase family protein/3-isopropylmalate dehydratase small subunit
MRAAASSSDWTAIEDFGTINQEHESKISNQQSSKEGDSTINHQKSEIKNPQTFAEKALARAAGLAQARAGEIVEATPDRILSHDNTAAIAQIFYKELGAKKVIDPERLCITLDHAVPPPTPQHAQNHAETRAFVHEQGVRHFFEAGRGICHQVLSEEALILPGQLILGADSHTTHYGWMGAFGAGVGRSEVAALWATGHLWLRVPEAIRVTLTGKLPPGVTSKDLCLYIIGQLGADGGLYTSLEFDGPGVSTLSLASRMVIPNMMAEFGVKNAYLPSDDAVFDWLARRSEVGGWRSEVGGQESESAIKDLALYPDADANYQTEYTLNLDQIEPLVACPPDVDNVRLLSEVAGQRVDIAFIGTCTNGRIEDLTAAAEVLRGHRINPGTRLLVIPASNQVYRQASESGILATLLDAGAMIGVPGCGPCMGNHLGIPAAGEVVISTANRNFKGRMGQPDAEIYLASPAVVAASAVAGRITHPAELIKDFRFEIADLKTRQPALVTKQATGHRSQVAISHQPSPIGYKQSAISHQKSKTWKYGDNVNTDLIFPGKYTYTFRKPEEIAAHALEDLDPTFAKSVKLGDVIFGGRNLGCGSSREQAATCIKYSGVAAIVAESFARIFYRNVINQGLPAIVCPEAVAAANAGDPVEIDLERSKIRLPAGTFTFPPFPPNVQALLKAGGLIPFLKSTLV